MSIIVNRLFEHIKFDISGVDMSDDVKKGIIDDIFAKRRLSALVRLRKTTRMTASQTAEMILNFWDGFREQIAKNSHMLKDIAPVRSCINCMGVCGNKGAAKAVGFFNMDTEVFQGAECPKFQPIEKYLKEFRGKFTVKNTVFSVDDGIAKLEVRYGTGRKKRPTKKMIIVDPARIIEHMAKKLSNMHNAAGYGEMVVSPLHTELLINGKKPMSDENYRKYFNRVQDEIRADRNAKNAKISSMSEEEAVAFINEYARRNSMASVLESQYKGDVRKFVNDFFPNKDLWEVVTELEV